MKKKSLKMIFAAFMLSAALAVSLCACGDKEDEKGQEQNQGAPTIDPNDTLENDNPVDIEDLLDGLPPLK